MLTASGRGFDSPRLHSLAFSHRPHAIIDAPAHRDLRDREQQTALMFAAKNGELDVVQAMIARKASLDAQRVDGFTTLHFAARKGHTKVVRALKSAGASLTLRDKRGRSAFDIAIGAKRPDAAAVLKQP